MEITGRLVANAITNQLKDGRKVVNFCVVVNDNYKSKGNEEVKKIASFFNCSYWVSASIAGLLKKGTLVELYGRVSVNAWSNTEGEAKASLNFHVNNIKLHGGNKAAENNKGGVTETVSAEKETEDLPF